MFSKRALVFLFFAGIWAQTAEFAWAVSINVGGVRVRKDVRSMKEIRRENVISQSLDYSCGPAGLATILNFYIGEEISEQEIIAELLRTVDLKKVQQRHGFSLLDLKRFCEQRGYKATGYKMDMDFVREIDKPVLVPIKFKNFRHFVVIKDVVGDRVFFADPAMGNMSMKVVCFLSIWQGGIGLVVESGGEREDPFSCSLEHALQIRERDVKFANHQAAMRNALQSAIRVAVYPSEF